MGVTKGATIHTHPLVKIASEQRLRYRVRLARECLERCASRPWCACVRVSSRIWQDLSMSTEPLVVFPLYAMEDALPGFVVYPTRGRYG